MRKENRIDYIELPAKDLDRASTFYGNTFGWTFEDYGPDYRAFSDGRLDGGFFRAEKTAEQTNGSVLLVFYAENLESLHQRVIDNGATISTEIFTFPGGRRFHFRDPNGNEMAVWSEA